MSADKFCWCGKLETGGIVVGIVGLVTNVLFIVWVLSFTLEEENVDDNRLGITILGLNRFW